MKKTLIALTASVLMMSSCGTYTGEGAYVGGSFGSILGSAIGGIAGGWRGSDIGTVVGMAGGAAIGAAIGSAADKKQAEEIEQYKRERSQRQGGFDRTRGYGDDIVMAPSADNSGFDSTNSGDDRIDFDGAGPRTEVPAAADHTALEIRNIRVQDADRDGVLRAGEECRISFEVMNRSDKVVYDVQPLVSEVTGNKRIHISPNLHVESIAPRSGIRYTASLLADKRLKDGTAIVRVGVAQGRQQHVAQMQEITVKTSRK